MFARRNLRVLSWVGHNILGNRDGLVLDDPENKASKVKSKDALLAELLGYKPQSHRVDRVHRIAGRLEDGVGPHPLRGLPRHEDDAAVHLAGLRLAAGRAAGDRPRPAGGCWPSAAARAGVLPHLACFFKSPIGVDRARLRQAVRDAGSSTSNEHG